MRLPTSSLLMSLVVATMTGCAGLSSPKPNLTTELSKPGTVAPDAAATKVDIIFQPEKGQPERMERALTEPTTVQQMLVQSGGLKKYRRVEVEIRRQRPGGGGYFTIPCEYDRVTRQIDPVNDYALAPGDKVIIKEDTSTVIDDIMRSAGGNLGKRFTTGGKHNEVRSKYRIEG